MLTITLTNVQLAAAARVSRDRAIEFFTDTINEINDATAVAFWAEMVAAVGDENAVGLDVKSQLSAIANTYRKSGFAFEDEPATGEYPPEDESDTNELTRKDPLPEGTTFRAKLPDWPELTKPAHKSPRVKRTNAELAAGIALDDVPECRASGLAPDAWKAKKYAPPLLEAPIELPEQSDALHELELVIDPDDDTSEPLPVEDLEP